MGLLPLALVGIDIDEVVQGIKDIDEELKNPDIFNNISAQNALIHYLLNTQKNKSITVMMPYSTRLQYVSDWFIHLWSESLGKEYNKNGEVVHIGQTPVKAVGVTDQYSQMQLFNEGPNNKIINFITVDKFDSELAVPKIFEYTGIGYLGGKSLNELLDAEYDSTKVTLSNYSRPTVSFSIPEINGYYIAQLLYILEMQTAVAGELYNIATFSQSGVEQAKDYTYALMGRSGYEESASEIKEKLLLV